MQWVEASKTTFEPSGSSFQRYHCWHAKQISLSLTHHSKLGFLLKHMPAEDFAQYIRLSKDWPWSGWPLIQITGIHWINGANETVEVGILPVWPLPSYNFRDWVENIDFSASKFENNCKRLHKYIAMHELGRTENQTFMDMATILAVMSVQMVVWWHGKCSMNRSVEIEVDVNGVKEPWLLMFKNQTHNHPTEIETIFGGAAIGGAIRDPLSGRSLRLPSHAYLSGAGDITAPSNSRW